MSDNEKALYSGWNTTIPQDLELAWSLATDESIRKPQAAYAVIRALRAGVPLEKLL